jgi:hypothetical protein
LAGDFFTGCFFAEVPADDGDVVDVAGFFFAVVRGAVFFLSAGVVELTKYSFGLTNLSSLANLSGVPPEGKFPTIPQ